MALSARIPTSSLNPRYRRRRLFVFVAGLMILSGFYMSSRFDSGMPPPDVLDVAQKLHLSTHNADQNEPPSPKDENGSSDTTDEAAAPLQFDDAQLGTVTNHDIRKQIPLEPVPPMLHGTSARPSFKNSIPIATLPPKHMPRAAAGAPRLIIIGDVHGQLKELKTLLEKAEYSAERGDHVIFTGDMINKGPDSAGVVALAMEMGASGVRGNHEEKVLRALLQETAAESSSAPEHQKREAETSKAENAALATARQLSPEQREWLAKLPVILRLDKIPDQDSGEWLVVHAGLVPDVPLEDQDETAVMNMRTLMFPGREQARQEVRQDLEDAAAAKKKAVDVSDTAVEAAYEREEKILEKNGVARNDIDIAVPTETRDGLPWSEAWNQAQRARKHKKERVSVVYGHDARTGLNIHPTHSASTAAACGAASSAPSSSSPGGP
ncbi:ser thr protein phosphatase family protein [Apiospora phragmitis]|uniref:Ser thr protein phosphatase family protein n=1 Tax=Apiospora phragmitis TaxID=2905665 RepID=A0ABR1TPS2_9PEZI